MLILQIQAIVDVLSPFKILMTPMLSEKTPALSFVVPRFNVLIQTLEVLVNKGTTMYTALPQTQFQKQLCKWKAKAAEAALVKIRAYYSKSLKVPPYALATGKWICSLFRNCFRQLTLMF